ncbi:hypothetical protein AB0I02_43795, partial [Streptomyces phaeochromogenes]
MNTKSPDTRAELVCHACRPRVWNGKGRLDPAPPGQDARMKGDLFSSEYMVQPATAAGMSV